MTAGAHATVSASVTEARPERHEMASHKGRRGGEIGKHRGLKSRESRGWSPAYAVEADLPRIQIDTVQGSCLSNRVFNRALRSHHLLQLMRYRVGA